MKIDQLNPSSKLWLYQANRALTTTEITWLNEQLTEFTNQWAAHGTQLVAAGEVLNPYFVALAVDLSHENASGCSIDSSVRFIKSVGNELKVDFFNRLKLLVEAEDGTQKIVSFKELNQHLDYSIYNPLVETVGELASKFKINVKSFLEQKN